MVDKFTLLELHLDDARFSNAVAGTPEEAEELLGEMEADEMEADELEVEIETDESDRGFGGPLAMAAVAIVVAVGVRTIARRFFGPDELEDALDEDEADDSIEVGLDEPVEA
jgi:hypothetical protein